MPALLAVFVALAHMSLSTRLVTRAISHSANGPRR